MIKNFNKVIARCDLGGNKLDGKSLQACGISERHRASLVFGKGLEPS